MAKSKASADPVLDRINAIDPPHPSESEGQTGVSTTTADKPPRDKAASWVRLANKRVPKALKALDALRKMGNKASYAYTDEQKAKLFALLREKLDALEHAYNGTKRAESNGDLF